MISRIFDSLLTVAYPQICESCGIRSVERFTDGAACGRCWERTRIFSGAETLCAKCGAFLRGKESDFETFCRRCDEHFYDAARAVGIYEFALAAAVLHLKREPFAAARCRRIFAARFENSAFPDADLIVPVPLSKKRLIERGFNQAAVLAKIIAAASKIELDEGSLKRRHHTLMHRIGMDGKARAASVKDAFEVKRPKLIEGAKILLIDDVFTSGATVSQCAETLKQSGARRVYVLTLAKTE